MGSSRADGLHSGKKLPARSCHYPRDIHTDEGDRSTASKRRNGSYLRPEQRFTASVDRVKQWQIGPGDKVRVLRGDPDEKFVDPEKGRVGGWKQHTIERIDKKFNAVYLKDIEVSFPRWEGRGRDGARAAADAIISSSRRVTTSFGPPTGTNYPTLRSYHTLRKRTGSG